MMRKFVISPMATSLFAFLLCAPVFADEVVTEETVEEVQESAQNPEKLSEQASEKLNQEAGQAGHSATESMQHEPSPFQLKAQSKLAPHTLLIETSLNSAMSQTKGLKSQLNTLPAPGSKESIEYLRTYKDEIKDSITMASKQMEQFDKNLKNFPELAQSEEYRQLNSALSDVKNYNMSLQKKMSSDNYWKDKTQVSSDVEILMSRLSSAMEKTQKFNNSKLEVASSFA